MIDFRYHVVSLVAVFIALSVGMVVGGFALREPVADGLSNQVKTLRDDKTQLRGQLTAVRDAAAKRDAYDAATLKKVVAGSLTGKKVALVLLPGTDDGLAQQVRSAVTTAGAQVTGVVTLSADWVEQNPAIDIATLAPGTPSPTGQNRSRVAGTVLAKAVLDPGSDTFARLDDAGLARLDGTPQRADSVLLLWSRPTDDLTKAAAWAEIVAGVGAGTATVLAAGEGTTGDPSSTDRVMTAVRDTPDAVTRLSTVDDAGLPMGRAAIALALRDEYAGHAGQYGAAPDATAVLPGKP